MAKKKTDRESRIEAEKARLNGVLDGLDANKLAIAQSLVDRAAFIAISLQDLENDLNKNGWVEEYQNGQNQHGLKKSAAAECHISLTKNLSTITKQLMEIAPAEQRHSKLQELMQQ